MDTEKVYTAIVEFINSEKKTKTLYSDGIQSISTDTERTMFYVAFDNGIGLWFSGIAYNKENGVITLFLDGHLIVGMIAKN